MTSVVYGASSVSVMLESLKIEISPSSSRGWGDDARSCSEIWFTILRWSIYVRLKLFIKLPMKENYTSRIS